MGKSRIRITDDGSHTLLSDISGETYHSSFGAIQESEHIFIKAGLLEFLNNSIDYLRILEVGTGTGLNVLLTYKYTENKGVKVDYDGYEPYPLVNEERDSLNYCKILDMDKDIFKSIHSFEDDGISISDLFNFTNTRQKIEDSNLPDSYYNLVYFDAFSPDSQPELWDKSVFMKIFNSLMPGGILLTYSCKGTVKRALKGVGFKIEKLPGPPGKREFLRATRPL